MHNLNRNENSSKTPKTLVFQIAFSVMISLLPSLVFCQKNKKTERVVDFKQEVKTIKIKSPMKVILTTETTGLVSVFGSKKAVNSIKIRQKNGRLVLRKAFFASQKSNPFIVVSAPDLQHLFVEENSVVESTGVLNLKALEVVVNADASVRLRIDCETVATSLKGNGTVHIEGYFKQSEIRKDPFGWCQVQYHRQPDAIVSDPH
ncbi:MAG: hypothetical protein GC192_20535 [Bacteroidetes bacterium]|nr:hypothetical protein [Bacteroidota bacterium]